MAGRSQQSPLWIITPNSSYSPNLAPLGFRYGSVEARLRGHDLELEHDAGLVLEFEGMDCPLRKLHFHAPSEHRIDGEIADIELHLVHEIPAYPERSGSAFVVVGVLLDLPRPDPAEADAAELSMTDWLKAYCGEARAKRGGESDIYTIDPGSFLPADRAYFRYEGSLTTEPFSELVAWAVLRDRGQLGAARRPEPERSRLGQALNRRFVLRSFE